MKLSFDHLVHIVNRPEEAIEDFATIGLKAMLGGRHEDWGTYNALCYFGLSYIEFLGVFDRKKAERVIENDLVVQTTALLPEKERFARIALRTNNMRELVHSFHKKGIETVGPIKAERKRADGTLIQWEMLFIRDEYSIPFPFIIQWQENDEIRKKSIEANNNALPLKELIFAVNNHVEVATKWSELFHLTKQDTYKDKKLKANCTQLQLEGCNIVFASPYAQGEIARVIETKGEGPCLLRISNSNIVLEKEMFGGHYQFV
ncbi:VOC family protein [Bacillus sporothermodurans]|uniref:VOC family protein n=2 Tax=Heyndrickxia sporothermodurans TaxID=46224 RepID=A0AB37HJ15_9BACI|nr:VOC family protein [Heyndrickxia sporothermodurans]MBL5772451.1 VOC family protein [Heyndrickxia sporothermodurans]MBL5774804.1 VOC family protein [Heyndrickxia sporothermodurans]MBL5792738.1 VOC family protein [Heyndrickxia sporothermodurans]MBL5796110.1 VOC family protein [Heyndrickxia sporothermodurans]MBL5807017.1 VOC family protein [Heyndrickxia sporothermodurans]